MARTETSERSRSTACCHSRLSAIRLLAFSFILSASAGTPLTEHIPLLLKVPGDLSAVRCTNEPLKLAIAGTRKTIVAEGEPRYSAMYELESPKSWSATHGAKAVDQGRWPTEVRPHLSNHRHVLRKIMR